MIKTVRTRIQQGYRTIDFPKSEPVLPERLRGLPVIDRSKCEDNCQMCVSACPTAAIAAGTLHLDMGKCLFCTACSHACPTRAIRFTNAYRLAGSNRDDLVVRPDVNHRPEISLDVKLVRLFHNSLKLRQVSAGGCNACEADINVLTTIVFDLGRFGVQIVASPRHADGLLVTGPVTENMRLALLKSYEAVPDPRLVIAVGACAISGGIFAGHPQQHNGTDGLIPVDVYIPGCPPHPMTILDAILRTIGKR
jgi:Ni,Fe-hydrogenase III small subunit/NAD-dependent dihydropyrimidine dehydrogenase PreA subunit